MSDDTKIITSAPSVHTDELWDRDKLDGGMVHNLGPEPVKVDTKTEYKRLLKERGLRMKDQAESDIAPGVEKIEAAPPPEIEIEPDMGEGQTRVLFAVGRVWLRYGLLEALHCDVCFEQGHPSGCRVTINGDRTMAIRCHNRTRTHRCMTDMSYTRADALTLLDKTTGTIVGPDGESIRPTTLIQPDDAKLILRHVDVLRSLRLNNMLYCAGCRTACELNVTPEQIVMTCPCHIRYWQSAVH